MKINIKPSLLALCLICSQFLFAEDGNKECSVAYDVMYQVALNEYAPPLKVGYPYIIGFNKNAPIPSGLKMVDKRTVNCENKTRCVEITRALINNGVTNIDLGAFQINYKWNPDSDLEKFFILGESYKKACLIIEDLVARHGWSWDTLGMYHNKEDKFRIPYITKIQERLYANNN